MWEGRSHLPVGISQVCPSALAASLPLPLDPQTSQRVWGLPREADERGAGGRLGFHRELIHFTWNKLGPDSLGLA